MVVELDFILCDGGRVKFSRDTLAEIGRECSMYYNDFLYHCKREGARDGETKSRESSGLKKIMCAQALATVGGGGNLGVKAGRQNSSLCTRT